MRFVPANPAPRTPRTPARRSRRLSPARLALAAIVALGSLAGAGALVAASATVRAGERLGPLHRDEFAGYALRVPADWDQIPTQPGEEVLVGIWQGTSRLGAAPRLEVLRWEIETVTEKTELPPETDAEGDDAEGDDAEGDDAKGDDAKGEPKSGKSSAASRFSGPTNFTQWFERFRKARGSSLQLEDEESVRSRDGLNGRLWLATAGSTRYLIATFRRGGREFGIEYRCADRDWSDAYRVFQSSVRSFEIFEPESSRADIEVENFSGTDAERQRRVEARIGLPSDWHAFDTEHYIFLSNADPRLVRDIARRIETMRTDYFERFFPPIGEIEAISVVRICADRPTYFAYGGPPGSAGYWYALKQELVFYEDQDNLRASFEVLHHEAFHQYIFYALGDVAPHTWFNEGNADYFGGAKFSGGRFRINPMIGRMQLMKNLIAQDRTYPLAKLIEMSKAEYYSDPASCYAHGWSFVYFLREEARLRAWRKILPTYFDTLKAALVNVRAGREPASAGSLRSASAGAATFPARGTARGAGAERAAMRPDLAGWGAIGEALFSPIRFQEDGQERKPGVQVRRPESPFDAARKYALDKAFEGVDIERLERAWLKAM